MVTYFIVGFVLGGLVTTVMFTLLDKKSDEKYDDMKKYYDGRIETLNKDIRFWRDHSLSCSNQARESIGKVKLYEKLLDKFIRNEEPVTDSLFRFEGRYYAPMNFSFHRDPCEADTLEVDFVHVDIRDRKKEKTNA